MQSQLDKTEPGVGELYDEDFFEWIGHNAASLRAGRFDQADIEHIAEEIEDMGKRDLNEVNSRVQVLVEHLLKWQLQPEKKSRSWLRTIASQRGVLAKRLEASPSLRAKIQPNLGSNYQRAVQLTLIETGLPKNHFPAECPFTVEQILDPEFLP
ncbi:MAG: DUF29 domain-containing protein [Bryobacteraceae bacterium]|jgi:hypothetical protein